MNRIESKRVATTGRMYAGKDHVLRQGGYWILGFADPMYELADYVMGSRDKSDPQVRSFLQDVGAWGRGMMEEGGRAYRGCPPAEWVEVIRAHGRVMAPSFFNVEWNHFGKDKNFWINIMAERIADLPASEKWGVSNSRTLDEVNFLTARGFEHWHVMCSPETRRERLGGGFSPTTEANWTERMAAKLDQNIPENRVIWNDHRGQPEGKNYVSVPEFCGHTKALNFIISFPVTEKRSRETQMVVNL